MRFIDMIHQKAKESPRRIVVPECTNELMMRSTVRAARAGIADIIFVGDKSEIEAVAKKNGIDLAKITVVDVGDEAYREALLERYAALPDKIMGKKSVARRMSEQPLYTAMVMQAVGDADCTFAGLDTTTYEFILAASGIIGRSEGISVPSAFLVMEFEDFAGEQGNCFGMADGAINLEPSSEDLACIAISCCETYETLTGEAARCAMMSSSTCGSGAGAPIDRMRQAVELANAQRPELMIDGEFQADAAVNKRVAEKKVGRPSEVAGQANVLVFADAAACNIGTKLLQQFAKVRSYGPIYQGFKQPFLDCSRGDDEERIFDNVALCSVLAAHQHGEEASLRESTVSA